MHLGGHPPVGPDGPHRADCLCPLAAVVAVAAAQEADALLVVGDLFDHARVSDEMVEAAFTLLGSLGVPVVLMVGNHDVHDDGSIYRRPAGSPPDAGLHFVSDHDGQEISLLEGALGLWGKAMEEHSPSYRPLHGVAPRPQPDVWYVVLGHGHHIGGEPPETAYRSSLITSADIADTGADYVALGHHHVVTDVSTGGVPAWYSGAPSGYGGGQALVVDLDPHTGVAVTAVPVELPACS